MVKEKEEIAWIYLNRGMIIKFFKSLMARKKRNEKFKKDFLKKTGVDLNQIDPGGNAKPRI
mgnify:CR=1 FL=1